MGTSIDLTFNGNLIFIHIIILLIAFGLAWLTYRDPNPPIGTVLKYFLLFIRAAVLAIVMAALLEPIMSLINRRSEEPVVAVMVDQSNSMTISDTYGDASAGTDEIPRQEVARSILEGNDGLLSKLRQQAEVKTYQFAKSTESDAEFSGSPNESNLGQALEYVDEDLVEQNLSSIIMISDGINNAGSDPTRVARSVKAPIYTVGIGNPEERKDIAISRFLTNETAYVDNEVPLEVTVRSNGFDNVRVPVQILWNDQVVAEDHLILQGGSMEQKLMLRFVPSEPGEQHYVLKIPVQEDELLAPNNVRDFVVNVLKSKIQVLHIAGRPSYDYGFLHRYMMRDPNVEPTGLVLNKDGEFFPYRKEEGQRITNLPQNPDELFTYDLIILADVHRRYLSERFENLVVDFVQNRGGALLMLGGDDSFQGGNYTNSPIADILPVTMTGTTARMRTGTFPIQVTSVGDRQSLMQLNDDPAQNERIWQSLPPLQAYNQVKGLKPGAELLATFEGTQMNPAVALHRAGKGKVMAFMAATYWQWDFMMLGLSGSNEYSDRFWSNVVRWLVSRDDIERVNLITDKKVYRSGESVNLAVQVYDETFEPQTQAEVMVTIRADGASEIVQELVLIEQEPGRYVGMAENLPPGDYTAQAIAEKNNIELGTDNTGFTVSEYSLEYENIQMNEPLLTSVAKNSGGAYFTPANVGELINSLKLEERIRESSRDIVLWDHPGMFLTLMILLGLEWLLRKRRGLA